MFRHMLSRLTGRVPQARGAIFCDHEGESVEWALAEVPPAGNPALSEYELKLCGAQLAAAWLLLDERTQQAGGGKVRELEVRTSHGTIIARAVAEGYYAVLLLAPNAHAPTARAAFALRETARELASEM